MRFSTISSLQRGLCNISSVLQRASGSQVTPRLPFSQAASYGSRKTDYLNEVKLRGSLVEDAVARESKKGETFVKLRIDTARFKSQMPSVEVHSVMVFNMDIVQDILTALRKGAFISVSGRLSYYFPPESNNRSCTIVADDVGIVESVASKSRRVDTPDFARERYATPSMETSGRERVYSNHAEHRKYAKDDEATNRASSSRGLIGVERFGPNGGPPGRSLYSCEECGEGFTSLSVYIGHKSKVHSKATAGSHGVVMPDEYLPRQKSTKRNDHFEPSYVASSSRYAKSARSRNKAAFSDDDFDYEA